MLLPGKPQPTLQAVCTGEWQRKRFIAYISGNAFVILTSVNKLLQTLYHPSPLLSCAFSPSTGQFAVSTATGEVHLYTPNNAPLDSLRWTVQTTFTPGGTITTLSFGATTSELLCGGPALTLWSTTSPQPRRLWHRPLATPCALATFSPDASLAASIAPNDRLVKIWRKIAIGQDEVQFDFSYLPHPRGVVNMRWRTTGHPDESADNVLYTIARDGVLRVWAPVYPHDVHLLQLWAAVDLRGGDGGVTLEVCSGFVVDSHVFQRATEGAVATAGDGGDKERASIQRLAEVAGRAPEVVVVFDAEGRMSAWGMENVGCKAQKTTNVFSIVQGEETGLRALGGKEGRVGFTAWAGGEGIVVLAHAWDGRIMWCESRIDRMLDPYPRGRRVEVKGIWSGHEGAVRKLVRTTDGRTLLTSTDDNDLYVWAKRRVGDTVGLTRQSLLQSDDRVRRAVIFRDGNFIMTLYPDAVVLWDTREHIAKVLERIPFASKGKVLTLLILPENAQATDTYHVVSVDASLGGVAWEVKLPCKHENSPHTGPHLRELTTFKLPSNEQVLQMVPVDPVGWTAVLSENLDMFSREVAITVCASGLLQSWTVKFFKAENEVRWLDTSSVSTEIKNPSLAKASATRKVAVVDETRSVLSIWDSRAGNLEFQKAWDAGEVIRDLDWTSTPHGQNILAVGFPHRVLLMCQLRYDYLDAGPAWAPFREIDISKMTPHPIGDSTWLHNGSFVIGCGNQLFVYPRKIEDMDKTLESLHLSSHKTDKQDLFNIVSVLNGPLPVYHPQFLQQCILTGKASLVETILLKLYKELQRYHEEIGLEPTLGIPLETFYEPPKAPAPSRRLSRSTSYFDGYADSDTPPEAIDLSTGHDLCSLLTSIPIPHLTGQEQIKLASMIESLSQVHADRRSIDENAAQFLIFFRQHVLRRDKSRSLDLTFREFNWAYQSASQDILVDIVTRNAQGKLLWSTAREAGMFMWLRDPEMLKSQFEVLARNHYTADSNPVDCSLYYLALRKRKVLAGLWRIASGNKEQAATHRFLSNNFSEPKWRTAALKNAYALMGKHRFEYAAAFFLLADALPDALNVIFTQMRDPQLAIAVARVYEGSDDSPLLHTFLETRILPHAASTANRWLAFYAFWLLSRRDLAVQSLLLPLPSLIPNTPAPSLKSRLFLSDDPALISFYQQIREKTSSTLRGAGMIGMEEETRFVMATARLLDRMGCDILALDLVRNWRFLEREKEGGNKREEGMGMGMRMGIRRKGSVVLDDVKMHTGVGVAGIGGVGGMGGGGMGAIKEEKKQVAVFEEPDMSWMF